jgi:hypothetical protein
MGRKMFRALIAIAFAACVLISPVLPASAQQWCVTDPKPASARLYRAESLRPHGGYFYFGFPLNALPSRVWCYAKGAGHQDPVVPCQGVGNSECGPYSWFERHLQYIQPGYVHLFLQNTADSYRYTQVWYEGPVVRNRSSWGGFSRTMTRPDRQPHCPLFDWLLR